MSAFPKTRAAAEYAARHSRAELTRTRAAALLRRLTACQAAMDDGGGQPPVTAAGLMRSLVLAVRDLAGPAWLDASGDDPDVAAFTVLEATASPPDAARIDEIRSRVLWARFAPAADRGLPRQRRHQIRPASTRPGRRRREQGTGGQRQDVPATARTDRIRVQAPGRRGGHPRIPGFLPPRSLPTPARMLAAAHPGPVEPTRRHALTADRNTPSSRWLQHARPCWRAVLRLKPASARTRPDGSKDIRPFIAKDHMTAVAADLRDPRAVLADPELRAVIDPTRPMCVILGAVLHFLDADAARTVTAGYARLMAPRSCLVISVASYDDESLGKQLADKYTAAAWHNHTPSDVESFFAGLELVGPSVTEAQTWRAWMPQPVLRHREGHVLASVAQRQA